MASIVKSRISTDMRKAGIYSILADESKDYSTRERLAIVLRYVDLESAAIHERFLTYVEEKGMDAEGLAISLSLLCFQFYLLFFPEFPIIFTHYRIAGKFGGQNVWRIYYF